MNVRTQIVLALLAAPLWAQTGGSITGAITGPSGAGVVNAQVSIKNTASGQAATTQTDPAGIYLVPNLGPGDYEVSVSAAGFDTQTSKVTLAAGAQQKVDMLLRAGGAPPSLKDLGFTPDQSQGSAQDQARLDKRSHMLKVHQRLGLIAAAPLLATIITSNGAAGRRGTQSGRDLHATLGGVTAAMYFTSAGFAMFAPTVPGTTTHGQIRLHKFLAWIHGPGMILTPALGAMAFEQRNKGEKVHGIASAHGVVAVATGVAYGLAILSVSVKF
jgi:hypothetical protein